MLPDHGARREGCRAARSQAFVDGVRALVVDDTAWTVVAWADVDEVCVVESDEGKAYSWAEEEEEGAYHSNAAEGAVNTLAEILAIHSQALPLNEAEMDGCPVLSADVETDVPHGSLDC